MKLYSNSSRLATWLLLVTLVISVSGCTGTKLYHQSYGNEDDPGIVFLHGGPGYNSASFEIGAAEAIARAGYHVVVYDRRGTSRSKVKKSEYTFQEAGKDLRKVMKANDLKSATLIGHSFGGAVGIKFAETHPEQVRQLILVGAPLDYSGTFEAIRQAARKHYEAENATEQLRYMDMLDTMDVRRLDYATYNFSHAMNTGLYSVDAPTDSAKAIYATFKGDPRAPHLFNMTQKPVRGFYDAHQYTTMDLRPNVTDLVNNQVPVYGIYGDQDGLFDEQRLKEIAEVLMPMAHFFIVENASHSVFLDQQGQFIRLLQTITRDLSNPALKN